MPIAPIPFWNERERNDENAEKQKVAEGWKGPLRARTWKVRETQN